MENTVLRTPVSLGDLGHSGDAMSVVDTLLFGNKDKENHVCVQDTFAVGTESFPHPQGPLYALAFVETTGPYTVPRAQSISGQGRLLFEKLSF